MKTILAMTVVAASVFASAASAAPVRHSNERALHAYGQATEGPALARDRDVVIFGGRVIGQDPDPNIRTQMLHDPVPSEY